MPFEEAREVAMVDNLQRADIDAIDEAQLYGEMLAWHESVVSLALRVGKEVAYVSKRLRLLNLLPEAQMALREQLITLDHALVLAPLGADDQARALAFCIGGWRTQLSGTSGKEALENAFEAVQERIEEERSRTDDPRAEKDGRKLASHDSYDPPSVTELRNFVASRSGIPLERAPWDLNSLDVLPAAGACSECRYNSQAETPLFAELSLVSAVCMNSECFAQKCAAHVESVADHLEQSTGKAPLRVSWTRSAGRAGAHADGDALRVGEWVEAKRKCDSARAAVTVDFLEGKRLRKPGEEILVCVDAACAKHHAKADESSNDAPSRKGTRLSATEAKALEKDKAERGAAEKLAQIEAQIRNLILSRVFAAISDAEMIALLAEDKGDMEEFREVFPDIPEHRAKLAFIFVETFEWQLHVSSYLLRGAAGTIRTNVAKNRKWLWELAEKAGISADAVAASYFHSIGSLAPNEDALYPSSIPWPERSSADRPGAQNAPAKKQKDRAQAASSKPKPAAKKTVKKKASGAKKPSGSAPKKAARAARGRK